MIGNTHGKGMIVAAEMKQGGLLKAALLASAVFNMGGMVLFSLPGSLPGQLSGLPVEVPAIYRYLTALFMLLFGAAYAWLAFRPRVDLPMVIFGTVGKLAAFSLMVVLWITAQIETRTLLLVSGDLVFALLFVLGLRASVRGAASA